MNYGRYFRLNQALSKVVDGVAIYDYVDLPAYFGPSEENPMSPKYPISVTITSDTLSFRLHYSAFKLDKSGDRDFPQYAYDKDDIDKKALNRKQVDIGMAHMEEVILELPFADISSSRLSDTIKNIYNSTFPQVIDENTSMGGRYLEQLIKKRFPVEKDKQSENSKDSVEDTLYMNLRKVSDETASYSTIWLMDLVHEGRIFLYSKQRVIDDKTKKEKEIEVITGFLRKLLLDFMFDLKHSDVFQNSANYQKMYSGLMSDFFFSALMHKCEYYYYRKLTRQAIDDASKEDVDRISQLYANKLIEAERLWINDIMSVQAEKHFEHYYRAYKWYHELLGHYSFSCWPSWFAEPEEEMRRVCFSMIENSSREIHVCNADTLVECLGVDTFYTGKSYAQKLIKYRDESYEGISRWFLKRYDFNDVLHLHITKHFNLFLMSFVVLFLIWLFDAKELLVYIFEKVSQCKELRVFSVISIITLFYFFLICEVWRCYKRINVGFPSFSFLKKLVLAQKHVSYGNKWKITLVFVLCIIIQGYKDYFLPTLMTFGEFFKSIDIACYIDNIGSKHFFLYTLFILFLVLVCNGLRKAYVFRLKKLSLVIARRSITIKKIGGLLFVLLLFKCAYDYYPDYGKIKVIIALVLFFLIYYYNRCFDIMPTIHPISSLHLLFPRLVAAITAAWFAMSMGFDIYVSFFDQYPQWYTALTISIVVFGFIMYEINRIMPSCSSLRKIYRSFEFLIISYCVSLLVGVVVINFVGEKFLERGGYIETYYEQYVNYPQYEGIKGFDKYETPDRVCVDSFKKDSDRIVFLTENAIKDENDYSRKLVDRLQYVYHSQKDKGSNSFQKVSSYPLVKKQDVVEGIGLFIMRDFLIMFSFIAMFWGIFISMIFTGEKQMTEL